MEARSAARTELGAFTRSGRLIVDDDGPVRVARRHRSILAEMELVHADVPHLKTLITQSFEEFARPQNAQDVRMMSCALSGGPPALIFLPALRAANVDWSRVTLYWTDERAVPADDPESNYAIAERMLLAPLGAKAPRAVRMPADTPNLFEAAAKYDAELAGQLRGGVLDLAVIVPQHLVEKLGALRIELELGEEQPLVVREWTGVSGRLAALGEQHSTGQAREGADGCEQRHPQAQIAQGSCPSRRSLLSDPVNS